MALDVNDTEDRIRRLIWTGFYTPEDVFEVISEEYLDPYSLSADDRTWIEETVEKHATAKTEAEASWAEETDWDRLDIVFHELDEAGILALHNMGTKDEDGRSDVSDITEQMAIEGYTFKGSVFYHEDSILATIGGAPLSLTFSPADAVDMIVGKLTEAGFDVATDEAGAGKLKLNGFNWLKRGLGDADDNEDDAEDDDYEDEVEANVA